MKGQVAVSKRGSRAGVPVGAATVAVSRPAPGERVLDACCGDGASAVLAADAVGPAGLVDAVDLSPEMVALAARRPVRHGNLRAHRADVTAWQPDGYDLVQCVLGVFFLPDMDAGTEHLIRCARPGGRVAITVWRRDALLPAGATLAEAVARHHPGTPAPLRSPARSQAIGTPGDLTGWLSARGLRDVRVEVVPHAVPATPRALWSLVVGSGFRALLEGLDAAAVEAVRRDLVGALAGGPALDATTLVATGTAPGA